jgi:ABC-type uncharacterized transport system substrate-binding protein
MGNLPDVRFAPGADIDPRSANDLHFETRWSAGNETEIRRYAEELIALAPDVILANGNAAVAPLLTATRSIPIVFAIVPDPVGAGFVESLARPGGNATGFVAFEYGLGAKWLEILKEIAPNVTRAGCFGTRAWRLVKVSLMPFNPLLRR